MELGAIDGVVRGDVEIVGISGHGIFLGDIGEIVGSAGGHFHDFAEELSFLESLLCPYTRVEVGSLLLEQIVGDIAELRAGTSADEEHLVALGHIEQLLDESLCLVHDGLEILGAMADFCQRKARAIKIDECIGCSLNDFGGQD